jgi:hypothetical protein
VSGHIYAQVVLLHVPTGLETGWAPKWIWMWWHRDKYQHLPRALRASKAQSNYSSPVFKSLTLPTELSMRLYKQTFVICFLMTGYKSRESSVGIALGYGLDDRGSRVRFSAGAGNFSLHHCVQNGSGAQPASYLMGTRGSFAGSKVAGA